MGDVMVSDWSSRRVLVSGAGGFIGSHLTELLARRGANVRAFVRYNSRNDYGRLELADPELLAEIEVYVGDLANPEAVARAASGCEVIFHLGALIPIPYSYRHPREFVTSNVEGTLNVLEAARSQELARIVCVSSSEVYGTAQTARISESHPLQAQSPYAATKIAADQLALSYWRAFGTPVVVARPFNTYGPRQSARAIIPTLISQALSHGKVEVGSTSPSRDFLFVEDTAAGILRCAEVDGIEGEVINLGTGLEISIGALAERIFHLIGRDPKLATVAERTRPAASEVERLCADTTKAESRLDWRPSIELDEGLRRTILWIADSLELFKTTIYNV